MSGLDSRIDRMESGGEIGERCPILKYALVVVTTIGRALRQDIKRKQTLRQKGKRHPGCDESQVAALSGKGKHPKTEGSKSLK